MVPPKPIPGESEEDFLKRKREYWRIKKKEQRARKAIRDKVITPKRASTNWRPILPAQDIPTQVRAAEEQNRTNRLCLITGFISNDECLEVSIFQANVPLKTRG